jgi:peptidoglycan/LPS O-acetylase OafA/YrhL
VTSDRPEPRSDGYRPDIDGLRAISILAVVLYHARVPGFGAGYLGVDVFFVISGFLITGQLLREAESTGAIRMAMFYARRVRRLLPTFAAMAVGTSALAFIYLLPMTEQKLFGNALVRSALFYYNIAVWRGGYAYDGEPAEQQVLMHTWSLGVEEQFYLVWPLICLVAFRIGRPAIAFAIVVLASLAGSWWLLPRDVDAVFFLLPFRAWELGLGACVAAIRWKPSSVTAGAGALVGAVLVALALASSQPPLGGLGMQLLIALGAALIVAFGAASNPASALLRAPPMVFLGRMSYSWYLWHWPLLVITRKVTFFAQPPIEAASLVVSFAVAAFTFRWIEGPMRRIPIQRPAAILAGGATTLVAVLFLGRAIESHGDTWMADPINASRVSRLAGRRLRPCETVFATLGCDLSGRSGGAGPSLLLWGDSFASALSPALLEYSKHSGSPVRLVFQSSCPPLLGFVPGRRGALSEPDTECEDALRSLQEHLPLEKSRISGVVLAARWPFYVPGDALGGHPKLATSGHLKTGHHG